MKRMFATILLATTLSGCATIKKHPLATGAVVACAVATAVVVGVTQQGGDPAPLARPLPQRPIIRH